MHGQPMPVTTLAKYSICTWSSSGGSLRVALYAGYISARNVFLPDLSSNTTAMRSGWLSSSSRISMRVNTYSAPVGMPSAVDSRTSRRSPREMFIRP